MTTEAEFIMAYKNTVGQTLDKDTNPAFLARKLNDYPVLRKMFFELFPKKVETEEDMACAGLGNLFGDR